MVFGGVANLPKIRFVVDGIPVPVEQKFNKITAMLELHYVAPCHRKYFCKQFGLLSNRTIF
jgi:hypothetical protein